MFECSVTRWLSCFTTLDTCLKLLGRVRMFCHSWSVVLYGFGYVLEINGLCSNVWSIFVRPAFRSGFRHGPFDILGGLGYFGKKIPCSDFGLKNNLAQWHSEKNNLSPIVQPELTYRLVWDVKIQNFLLARFARQKIINNFWLYLLPARHVKIYFQTASSFVWSLSDILYTLYPYFTIRITN